MDAITSLLDPIIALIMQWLPAAIIAVVVLLIVGYFAITWTLRRWAMWRGRMSKDQYMVKAALLALEPLVEKYAPASRFEKDGDENRRGKQWAFLSPYPRAVKASNKRYGRIAKGKIFTSRRQIAEAAKRIEVRDLPESEAVIGEAKDHYRIDFKLDGHAPDEFDKMKGQIAGQLGLSQIDPYPTNDNFAISYIAHVTPPMDVLMDKMTGNEFFEEHPAVSPFNIPLGIRKDGKVWYFLLHHTLIYGTSGSGKGSPLQGIVRQVAPFCDKGLAEFYAIDPKNAEFKLYNEFEIPLFKRISTGIVQESVPDHMRTIAMVRDIIAKRQANARVSIVAGEVEDGRSFNPSKETPLVIFMIDEYLTLVKMFEAAGREGKRALGELQMIIATGRSFGVFIIAATQVAEKDTLNAIRDNISNFIVLRQTSSYFNDLFLGEGATARGFDSRAIPVSSKANNYRSAGIAYVADDAGGDPVKIRFAYTDKEAMAELTRRYVPQDQHAAVNQSAKANVSTNCDFAFDPIDDGGFAFEEIEEA